MDGLITKEELRKVRREAGLSQMEFAKLVGVGQVHLSRMERGARRIMPSVAFRLSMEIDNLRWRNDVIAKAAMVLAIERYFDLRL